MLVVDTHLAPTGEYVQESGKTKFIFIDRSGKITRTNELTEIDEVHKFVSLVSQISDDGQFNQEIIQSYQVSKIAVKRLKRIRRDRAIHRKTKLKLIRTSIFSIFL